MLPKSIVSCSFSWVILLPLPNINGVDNCIPRTNVLGGGGGGDYGLVIVMPRPQIILCERDNLHNIEWIASILFIYNDIGERTAGKQDGLSLIIEGPPIPPPPPE